MRTHITKSARGTRRSKLDGLVPSMIHSGSAILSAIKDLCSWRGLDTQPGSQKNAWSIETNGRSKRAESQRARVVLPPPEQPMTRTRFAPESKEAAFAISLK